MITNETIKDICVLTKELTILRQNECKNLVIENFAPDIFEKLLLVLKEIER